MAEMRTMPELSEHKQQQIAMHKEVAEMYRRRAGYAFAQDFQEERNALLMALLPQERDARSLDLGCGTGITLNDLARRFRVACGIDLSHEMLTGFVGRAPDARGNVLLLRGDMGKLPLQSNAFDVILCRSALHHMDDEVAVLTEVCRILKPNGRLVLGEPANDFPLFRLARWIAKRGKSYGKIHTIDRAYTRGQLRAMFARAGLAVHRETRFGFIAYALCDNPDLVPILKKLPAGLARGIGATLRAVDRVLSHVPLLKNWSWYTMLDVRRADATAS